MDSSALITIINNAFDEAVSAAGKGINSKSEHKNRSKIFVEALGEQFRKKYKEHESYRVFTKHFKGNRKEFGINELLYDVLVCETTQHNAPRGKAISIIKKAVWQIESEFARDTQQAICDFNKLVIGAAANKLFIGPIVYERYQNLFLEALSKVAGFCVGEIYLAQLPHPEEWGDPDKKDILIWRFEEKQGWCSKTF